MTSTPKAIPARDIPLDSCVACGGPVRELTLQSWIRPTKPEVTIHDVTGFECRDCREQYFNSSQTKLIEVKTNEALREAQGLLSGDEISQLVESLTQAGLNISKLSEAIGVSRQEIHRWIAGQRIQSTMADSYLRFIASHPDQFIDSIAKRGIVIKRRLGNQPSTKTGVQGKRKQSAG